MHPTVNKGLAKLTQTKDILVCNHFHIGLPQLVELFLIKTTVNMYVHIDAYFPVGGSMRRVLRRYGYGKEFRTIFPTSMFLPKSVERCRRYYDRCQNSPNQCPLKFCVLTKKQS